MLDPFYAGGSRYRGGFGSTALPMNTPAGTSGVVPDSYHDLSAPFDSRPSAQGGANHVPNFHSFHVGGANFAFCDGSVRYLRESIDLRTYQALSTIQGGEVVDGTNQ